MASARATCLVLLLLVGCGGAEPPAPLPPPAPAAASVAPVTAIPVDAGAAAAAPRTCGGFGGVLCPAGFYCKPLDAQGADMAGSCLRGKPPLLRGAELLEGEKGR